MKRFVCYLAICVAIVGVLILSAQAQEAPTMRDIYKYVWDFVIVGDGEATSEDLEVFHNYFSKQTPEKQADVAKTVRSNALGEREKRQAIRENLVGIRSGTVVTKKGETLRGIVQLYDQRYPLEKAASVPSGLYIALENGGSTEIPASDIVQAKFAGPESIVETREGTTYRGQISVYEGVHVYTRESNPIRVFHPDIDKLILGSLKQVKCPSCFRIMEIDWKFCPYDGTKLQGK